eukprot:TRINITY_DN4985_c0_g1_i1.p1 TRINITY_DN4985_c0_g1~~TRINITY_DN4985_c0_g1_i1.p1  ORF type:complete len:113 (+),score=8.45 TRINITY_DN4985_c0_g1_i1:251-589(+)
MPLARGFLQSTSLLWKNMSVEKTMFELCLLSTTGVFGCHSGHFLRKSSSGFFHRHFPQVIVFSEICFLRTVTGDQVHDDHHSQIPQNKLFVEMLVVWPHSIVQPTKSISTTG